MRCNSAVQVSLIAGVQTLLLGVCLAQVTFERTYACGASAVANSVQQTADGGYVIAGRAVPDVSLDALLIKTDALGDTQWTRTYGGPDADAVFSVQQTLDGGYVLAGNTRSYGAGGEDVWLLKTDAQGDTRWTRVLGGTRNDYAMSVRQTSDSGYIVAGTTRSFGAGRTDVWLLRTDAYGDTLWTRTYGDATDEEGYSVQQTPDGGYIVTGSDEPAGSYFGDVYLIRTDAAGDTLWTRTYGDTSEEIGYSVVQASDRGFAVAGANYSVGNGCVWLIKTDSLGDTLWTQLYASGYSSAAQSVIQTADSGYAITGYCSPLPGSADIWLVRTDAVGESLWTRSYGGAYEDMAYCVAPTADAGLVLVGYKGRSTDTSDVVLVKTDSEGRVEIEEESVPTPHGSRPRATVCRRTLKLHVDGRRQTRARLELLDITGRVVLTRPLHRSTDGPLTLDIRGLSPGVYFVRPGTDPARRVLILN